MDEKVKQDPEPMDTSPAQTPIRKKSAKRRISKTVNQFRRKQRKRTCSLKRPKLKQVRKFLRKKPLKKSKRKSPRANNTTKCCVSCGDGGVCVISNSNQHGEMDPQILNQANHNSDVEVTESEEEFRAVHPEMFVKPNMEEICQ